MAPKMPSKVAGEKGPVRKVLKRQNTPQAVEKSLRDNFKGWSEAQTHGGGGARGPGPGPPWGLGGLGKLLTVRRANDSQASKKQL